MLQSKVSTVKYRLKTKNITMKKLIFSALVLALTVSVHAQEGKRHRSHGMKHRSDMIRKLNLTEEQKAQFKTENEAFRKKMSELKKNDNMMVKDLKSQMGEARKQHKEKIQSILTKEQKDQMQKMRIERKEKMEGYQKERAAKMKETLGLTADQQAKLDKNRSEMKEKMKSIREDKSLDDAAKKEKMKELMKGNKESMKSILTEEQRNKMMEMKKQHQQKRKGIKKETI
jgi:Spy/CpxP family protein refolding chaperone